MEEGAGRTRVGLNGALAAYLATARWGFAHGSKPSIDIGGVHFPHQGNLALLLQETAEQTERGLVPLQGLLTRIASFVIEQVVRDGSFHGGTGAPFREQRRLLVLAFGLFHLCCRVLGSSATTLCLGVQLGALGGSARLRHIGGGLL